MHVTVEDVSGVKKTLHIEIPQEEVVRQLDSAYSQLKKTAKIKGFRPGKAPRSVLERMFKKDVHADVSSKLIKESFIDALKEADSKIRYVQEAHAEEHSIEIQLPFLQTGMPVLRHVKSVFPSPRAMNLSRRR